MPSYRLNYHARSGGEANPLSIAFEAPDVSAALNIAFRHAGNRAADLWCDGRMLCRIECPDESGGFWLIS